MRFRFLGTGTSAGIPAIACDCAVCASVDPRDQRLRAGASLEFRDAGGRERVLLIDATPDLRAQALAARLARCDAVLFTHNHVDHTFGVDELRRFNLAQGGPVEVYAEARVMDHLRRVYQHIFQAGANVNPSFVASLLPREIEPGRALELFSVRVVPIRLLHGRLPILGFRVEAAPALERAAGLDPGTSPFPLAYCTDVSGIPPESWRQLAGLSTLVLDALRHRAHPTHFTLGQAVAIAHEAGARATYFTHMAHDLGHAQTQATLPPGMYLAYDGLVLQAAPRGPAGP
ncbi:MAG TPA: MBL fold metallo-hydrolase [Phycisphaerales bacterium]|nr:MBL fold metallo-hydrolase [Phycisphaerales bacterium]